MGHFSWTGARPVLTTPAMVLYAKIRFLIMPARIARAAGGIYIDGGSNITVEINIVYNYKWVFHLLRTPGKTNNNNILRNNIAYNCSLSGLFIGSTRLTVR
jgi:hypothetical protein